MNEAEKEILIKKDIVSIENRVRHAFNQGYEMGMKENKEQGGDEELDFVPEHKKIPCTMIIGKPCGDTISRAYIGPIIEELENICVNGDEHILDLLADIKNAPSATPQQKMGNWIESKGYDDIDHFYVCSECGRYINLNHGSKLSDYPYCHCGAKMEEVKG